MLLVISGNIKVTVILASGLKCRQRYFVTGYTWEALSISVFNSINKLLINNLLMTLYTVVCLPVNQSHNFLSCKYFPMEPKVCFNQDNQRRIHKWNLEETIRFKWEKWSWTLGSNLPSNWLRSCRHVTRSSRASFAMLVSLADTVDCLMHTPACKHCVSPSLPLLAVLPARKQTTFSQLYK